jgi:hypothetical protein
MKAKTIKGNSVDELSVALSQVLTDDYKPTLAIVFLSIKQDREGICHLLDKEDIQIFGATTAGEFTDGEIGDGSVAIMLLDINPSYYKLIFEDTGEGLVKDIACKVGEAGIKAFAKPVFLVASSGIGTDGEMIIQGIEEMAGNDVAIFGGMAGDDFTMTGTFVFTNHQTSGNGLIAVVIDGDKVNVKGLATSGWKPVGTVRTVTKSAGNVVYTIDDEPALDVVVKFMGIKKDIDEWKDVIVNIGSEFPFQLQRENAVAVNRAPLFANKSDRSLVCAGSVPQGSKIRFSLPPDFDIIDKVVDECNTIKSEEQPNADALIMFSCKARHLSLGLLVSDEIDNI